MFFSLFNSISLGDTLHRILVTLSNILCVVKKRTKHTFTAICRRSQSSITLTEFIGISTVRPIVLSWLRVKSIQFCCFSLRNVAQFARAARIFFHFTFCVRIDRTVMGFSASHIELRETINRWSSIEFPSKKLTHTEKEQYIFLGQTMQNGMV